MSRRRTPVEIAFGAKADPARFAMALDEFYLDHPDKAAQQRRLDVVPAPVGDPLIETEART